MTKMVRNSVRLTITMLGGDRIVAEIDRDVLTEGEAGEDKRRRKGE